MFVALCFIISLSLTVSPYLYMSVGGQKKLPKKYQAKVSETDRDMYELKPQSSFNYSVPGPDFSSPTALTGLLPVLPCRNMFKV